VHGSLGCGGVWEGRGGGEGSPRLMVLRSWGGSRERSVVEALRCGSVVELNEELQEGLSDHAFVSKPGLHLCAGRMYDRIRCR
jgi:hypothetical protein